MDRDFGNFGIKGIINLLPFMPSFIRLKNISIEDYLNKLFKNSDLKEILFRLFPVKKLPAIMAVIPLSYMHRKEGGYPLGGSLNFARAIENKYKTLNGSIIIDNNCVTGIELDHGRAIHADIIVSACDGRKVLFELLQEKYLTDKLRRIYYNPSLWPPIISISLGVNRDLSHLPEIIEFKLKNPAIIAGKEISWSGFFNYCHDSALSPPGKSVIKAQIETDYSYWKNLYEKNPDEYNYQKKIVLNQYISILNNQLPEIKKDIEVTDIATPVTWERYTGNWQGSYQGWLPTTRTFGINLPKKLPGLKNFYMTGQWVFPGGGVPMCMAQAKNLIKIISNDYK
jgi:phytoene dehydrogenase-like protein